MKYYSDGSSMSNSSTMMRRMTMKRIKHSIQYHLTKDFNKEQLTSTVLFAIVVGLVTLVMWR